MARHWAPLKNQDKTQARSRNTVIEGLDSSPTQFGQRPLFSEPGEDQPLPDGHPMPSAMRNEDINPSDGRPSAEGIAEAVKAEFIQPVPFHVVSRNVASPPTAANIEASITTSSQLGHGFIIRDGTGAAKLWFVVRGGGVWYYAGLTKAV